MVNLNKKGISPVIATILLLAITVIIAVGVYQFLNTYTQDTFDNVSGDATIDLAFANKVTMYDSGTNVTVNIGRTTFPDTLNFTEFVFQGPNGLTINCDGTNDYEVATAQSNQFEFPQDGSGDCSGDAFVTGQYDLIMIGDTTVRVDAIDYR